jgi:Protein of unknown function (DUF2568)
MELIQTANVVLRFLLELAVLAALGFWGFHTGTRRLAQVALLVGTPLLATVVWGIFVAPASPRDLPDPWRLLVELVVFGAAAAGLLAAGRPAVGVVFALLAVLNALLLRVWGQ